MEMVRKKREWLHVADNVRAILCVVEEGEPGAIYNVGSGKEHTNLDIVRLICQLVAEENGNGPGGGSRENSAGVWTDRVTIAAML